MYIDTHAHIYEEEFRDDREEVIRRAQEAGIRRIVLPDIDSDARRRLRQLAGQYPDYLLPLAGLHPTSVHENYREELAAVEKEVGTRTCYGIGECGIDLHWDKSRYREQIKAFEHQLGIAADAHLPVVIHARDALELILGLLEKHPRVRGILHCFPGGSEDARRAVGMGFLLGIGGIVTFRNSLMAETVRQTGPDSLVLETDAPYLAPVPRRGKRNESANIPLIAGKIAEITGATVKKIAEITTRNAANLFNLQTEKEQEN